MRRTARALACAAALAGASIGLAACSNSGNGLGPTGPSSGTTGPTTQPTVTPTTGTGPISPGGLVWILTRSAVVHISADPAALAVVRAGRIYEIVTSPRGGAPGVDAVLTESFGSVTGPDGIEAAVNGNQLYPGVKAVLYDPEHWSFTPAAEQTDVASYIRQAVTLAHAHGLTLIVTPALDLAASLGASKSDASREAILLGAGIEAAAAAADVVDIQAQTLERDTSEYESFVSAAVQQIRAHSSTVTILAGLSTNPPPASEPVDAGELEAAIEAVHGQVGGFWLNIPARGPHCGGCGPTNPVVGTTALDSVFG